jgi:hypothetical protein
MAAFRPVQPAGDDWEGDCQRVLGTRLEVTRFPGTWSDATVIRPGLAGCRPAGHTSPQRRPAALPPCRPAALPKTGSLHDRGRLHCRVAGVTPDAEPLRFAQSATVTDAVMPAIAALTLTARFLGMPVSEQCDSYSRATIGLCPFAGGQRAAPSTVRAAVSRRRAAHWRRGCLRAGADARSSHCGQRATAAQITPPF